MRLKKRMLGALALGSTALLVLSGCAGGNSDEGGDGGDGGSGYTIGVLFENEAAPNTAPIREAMQAVADEEGVEIIATDSKSDTASELTHMEDLITRGVDAIVMQPVDGEGSQPAAKRANEAGIPLFTLNTSLAEGADVDIISYIGQNETDAGKLQAEYMNEQLPDGGKILFIAGTYGASWTDRRRDGFDETINANIEIAAEVQANCSRAEAQRGMEDMLQRFTAGTIVGAVAQCDETAIGGTLAIAEAGRQDDFRAFVSVDGDQAGLEAIQEGILKATVAQDFSGQGKKAAEVVIASLNGEEVDEIYAIPFTFITQDNVAEFLK